MEGMIPLRSNLRVDVDGELGLLCGVFIAIGVAVVSGLISGGFEAAQGGSFGEGSVVGFTEYVKVCQRDGSLDTLLEGNLSAELSR